MSSDRRLTIALVCVTVAMALWPVFVGLPSVQEDGFYYLEIARNISLGLGSTFDGSRPTNGYHPLWLLCLLPIVSVISDDTTVLLLVALLQAALVATAAACLFRTARRLTGAAAAATATLCWMLLTRPWWLEGLEFALQCGLLSLAFFLFVRDFTAPDGLRLPAESRPYGILGSILALCFLARLDAGLVAAVLGVVLALVALRRGELWRHVGRLALFALPITVAGIGYVTVNLRFFGHAMPVSGAVKRSWSAELLAAQPFFQENGWLMEKLWSALRPLAVGWGGGSLRPLAFSLTATGIWVLIVGGRRWLRRSSGDEARDGDGSAWARLQPWLVISIGSYLMYVVTFHRGLGLAPRYFVVQPLLASLIVGLGTEALGRRRGRRAGWSVATLSLCLLIGATARDVNIRLASPEPPLHRAAAWSAEHLPRDARIGSFNAGALGFPSGRTVVNLDGLVNSWRFFLEERHDMCGFLGQDRITHVVDLFHGTDEEKIRPMLPIPLELGCTKDWQLLWIDRGDAETWSVRAYGLPVSGPAGGTD